MADALTQADVEKLLNAVAPASGPASKVENAETLAVFGDLDRDPGENISSADDADRLSNEQIGALEMLHDALGRNYAAELSGLLHSNVEVTLNGIHQLLYADFASHVKAPTCFNLLRMEPRGGHWILDVNLSILFPIIDRLLGGRGEPTPALHRPLTEIELRLTARITGLFLDELRRAWMKVIDWRISVERVESDPQLVQSVAADEWVVLISFEVGLGESRGMMSLCVPLKSIHGVGEALSSNSLPAYDYRVNAESTDRMVEKLPGDSVQLVAQLADSKISTADLVGLRVGDIINTEQAVESPILIRIDGASKYRASLGALKGRKAIRIEEPVAVTAPESTATGDDADTPAKKA
jgi:flagellar motor switch protein FliM